MVSSSGCEVKVSSWRRADLERAGLPNVSDGWKAEVGLLATIAALDFQMDVDVVVCLATGDPSSQRPTRPRPRTYRFAIWPASTGSEADRSRRR